MWSSRLFWKLCLAYGFLYAVLCIAFIVIEGRRHENLVVNHAREQLRGLIAVLTSNLVRDIGLRPIDELQRQIVEVGWATGYRLTVVKPDGQVLADSHQQPSGMQNQRNRPELIGARETGIGESIGRSETSGVEMYYLAVPVIERGTNANPALLRAGMSLSDLHKEMRDTRRLVGLVAACVGLLAAPLSYLVAGRIVKPLTRLTHGARAIAAGDFSYEFTIHSRDELGELGAAFARMQEELARRVRELEQYAQRLATVFGGMAEGVLAVDPQLRIILANDACKSLLGIKTHEVTGKSLMETTRSLEIQSAVLQVLDSQQPCEREIVGVGTPRRVLRILATRLQGEPYSGVIVVLNDTTELRRLETLRRDFVANVSHELKTPLASIHAYSETLLLGAIHDPEHNVRFVEKIAEQAQRLHQLIVDLLHLSRVECGKEAFRLSRVSLREVVEQRLLDLQEVADSHGVSLVKEELASDATVWADRQGIITLLDNLIDNAIKYTPPGGRVSVRCRREAQAAVIEIQDSGIGIAPEEHERIFERFYRVDKARSRELGGTGLGLAIVKHLAQAFGGEVSVTSQLGSGSTFAVRWKATVDRNESADATTS